MKKTVEYRLRNEPEKHFQIAAEAQGAGSQGSVVKATIERYDERVFHYEVRFGGPFAETKANFNEEMYLETALSIICSQLESHIHEDTLLFLEEASGLMQTKHPAKLDWVE